MEEKNHNLMGIKVNRAKHLGGLAMEVEFSDGKKDIIDFYNFIFHHPNPMINQYRDEQLFKNFQINLGNIEWGDLDMIFTIDFLYNFNQKNIGLILQ